MYTPEYSEKITGIASYILNLSKNRSLHTNPTDLLAHRGYAVFADRGWNCTAGRVKWQGRPELELTLVEVSHRAQQGGVSGLVGSVQKDFAAKQIDDQTPLQVISTDDNGAEIQIIDGPLKGQSGFCQ